MDHFNAILEGLGASGVVIGFLITWLLNFYQRRKINEEINKAKKDILLKEQSISSYIRLENLYFEKKIEIFHEVLGIISDCQMAMSRTPSIENNTKMEELRDKLIRSVHLICLYGSKETVDLYTQIAASLNEDLVPLSMKSKNSKSSDIEIASFLNKLRKDLNVDESSIDASNVCAKINKIVHS